MLFLKLSDRFNAVSLILMLFLKLSDRFNTVSINLMLFAKLSNKTHRDLIEVTSRDSHER